MISKSLCSLFTLFIFLTACQGPSRLTSSQDSKTQLVNTFLGTAPFLDPARIGYTPLRGWRVWAGLTYPGASLPNAMVQLSPITKFGSGAGYEYEDTVIHAFTHTNKGHWDQCNIPVLPVTGKAGSQNQFRSKFSHDDEAASPGYYRVFLKDFNIDVQLTSTLRTGFHRYNFPSSSDKKIWFNLSRANNPVNEWRIDSIDANTVSGYQQMHQTRIYFFAKLNTEIERIDQSGDNKSRGSALVHLKDDGTKLVEMKIALSWVSAENAALNLQEEVASLNFETVRETADKTWENLLSRIAVKGGTPKQQWVFYSSLYRAFLWPALRSDINGDYSDELGNIVRSDFSYYTTPALWDTYRNKLVLLTLLSPRVTSDVIRSMKDIGDKRGFLPGFFHGDHGSPFIAGAYARGIRWEDEEGTYRLMLKNATIENGVRPFLKEYMEKGFISDPHVEKPQVETKARAGVSKTLEYAYDDYSVAQMALRMRDSANYRVMMQRSENYKNVFDPGTNFMRGRLSDGSWISPFDPQYPYYEYMYREANAWHVSFFAPHNMPGLINLYGSAEAFEKKLDTFFTRPWNPKHIARNISGFVGLYCHGNQPDHEAPFSYHFINKPWKSQQIIDTVLNHYYAMGEHELALCGMDDAGEMSSWFVFSAMGIYPFSPADPEYIVSVPIFDEIEFRMPAGEKLRILKKGKGRKMERIELNGKPLTGYFAAHAELFRNGGELVIFTTE